MCVDFTSDGADNINNWLKQGWKVKNIIAQHVSTSTGSSCSNSVEGKALVILEKD